MSNVEVFVISVMWKSSLYLSNVEVFVISE